MKEKIRTKRFVDSFNQEAERQNNSWYAETRQYESSFDRHAFVLTHLKNKDIYNAYNNLSNEHYTKFTKGKK